MTKKHTNMQMVTVVPPNCDWVEFYLGSKRNGVRVQSRFKGVYAHLNGRKPIWVSKYGRKFLGTFPFTEQGELDARDKYIDHLQSIGKNIDRLAKPILKKAAPVNRKLPPEPRQKFDKKMEKARTAFYNIKARCSNPRNTGYRIYGARGIKLSEEFQDITVFVSYLQTLNRFQEYLDDDSLSIDRIDNDLGYQRGNLRIANKSTQAGNIRARGSVPYRGVTRSVYKKFECSIAVNRERVFLGSFKSAEDAAMAYDNYVIANNLDRPTNFRKPEKQPTP